MGERAGGSSAAASGLRRGHSDPESAAGGLPHDSAAFRQPPLRLQRGVQGIGQGAGHQSLQGAAYGLQRIACSVETLGTSDRIHP